MHQEDISNEQDVLKFKVRRQSHLCIVGAKLQYQVSSTLWENISSALLARSFKAWFGDALVDLSYIALRGFQFVSWRVDPL